MGKTSVPSPAAAPAPLVVPPLHAAVWAGDLNRVRALLQQARDRDNNSSSNSNTKENDSDATVATTPLNSTSALKQLLETKDAHGNSALHLAVRLVHPAQRSIVQFLLVRARACVAAVVHCA